MRPPERWLPPSVTEPIAERQYLARVGFGSPAARIGKQVEVTLGQPEVAGHWLVIPVAWRATGPCQLFPVLDAKLTVEPPGTHSSKLWLGGSDQPPLGALSREIDEAVMHNVAGATSKTSSRASRRDSRSSHRTGPPEPGFARQRPGLRQSVRQGQAAHAADPHDHPLESGVLVCRAR